MSISGFAAASFLIPWCKVLAVSVRSVSRKFDCNVLAGQIAIDRLVELQVELLVRNLHHVEQRSRHDDAEQQEHEQQAPEECPGESHRAATESGENL